MAKIIGFGVYRLAIRTAYPTTNPKPTPDYGELPYSSIKHDYTLCVLPSVAVTDTVRHNTR